MSTLSLYNKNNLAIAIDIGNTFTSIGFFKDGNFYCSFDMRSKVDVISGSRGSLLDFKKKHHIENSDIVGGLICSVVPSLTNVVSDLVVELFGCKLDVMMSKHFSYLKMDIDNPLEVGGDIAADIAQGYENYPHPCLIVDLGTISKNIYLDDKGVFTGTSFFPGVEACLKAMNEKTALLPDVNLDKHQKNVLGKNTVEAMTSGIYFGTLSGIRSLASDIEKMSKKKLTKVLTGGNARLFADALKDFTYDPHHVLKGIYLIYKNN